MSRRSLFITAIAVVILLIALSFLSPLLTVVLGLFFLGVYIFDYSKRHTKWETTREFIKELLFGW